VILDDLLATGNTAKAACNLIKQCGGKVIECAFVVELTDFNAREKLKPYSVFSLIQSKEAE
jgi:adenine phosphoribosyltransferase